MCFFFYDNNTDILTAVLYLIHMKACRGRATSVLRWNLTLLTAEVVGEAAHTCFLEGYRGSGGRFGVCPLQRVTRTECLWLYVGCERC